MKKLFFLLTGLALMAAIAGCAGITGPAADETATVSGEKDSEIKEMDSIVDSVNPDDFKPDSMADIQ